jgi:hypothetical protein
MSLDGQKRQMEEDVVDVADPVKNNVTDKSGSRSPIKCKKFKINNYKECLLCPICFDTVIKPSAISCGHMFCLQCISNYCNKGGKACPMCRSKISVKSKFQVNNIINDLVKCVNNDNFEYILRCDEHTLLQQETLHREIYLNSSRYDTLAEMILDFIGEEGYRKYDDIIEYACSSTTSKTSNLYADFLYETNYLIQYLLQNETLVWIDAWLIDMQCLDEFLEEQVHISNIGQLIAMCSYPTIGTNITRNIKPLQSIYNLYNKYLPDFLRDPEMERKVLYLTEVKLEIERIKSQKTQKNPTYPKIPIIFDNQDDIQSNVIQKNVDEEDQSSSDSNDDANDANDANDETGSYAYIDVPSKN